MKASYSFHGLVDIEIDQQQLDLISFYDHYFRLLRSATPGKGNVYAVREYASCNLPSGCREVGSAYRGFSSGICSLPERYALDWKNGGLTEYTDSPNRATNLWLQQMLLGKGLSLVHSAGLSLGGKGFVFPAFGGAGKTMLIAALRHDPDFRFFGDDFVAVDGTGRIYSYPSDLSIYEQHLELFPELSGSVYGRYFAERERRRVAWQEWYRLPGNPLLRRLAMPLRGAIDPRTLPPPFPLLPAWDLDYVKVPVTEVIPRERIGTTAPLSGCLLLSRYAGSDFRVERIAADELVRRIMGILAVEFRYSLVYLHLLEAFGIVDAHSLERRQQEILAACCERTELYEIMIPAEISLQDYGDRMATLVRELAR